MARRGRPAQGRNSTKKLVKLAAGGTNDRIRKTSRNTNNRFRRTNQARP